MPSFVPPVKRPVRGKPTSKPFQARSWFEPTEARWPFDQPRVPQANAWFSGPARLSPAPVHIQAKLEISRPGDALEREADQVADRLISSGPAPSVAVSSGGAAVQRGCDACEDEKNHVQRQTSSGAAGDVGAPLDGASPNVVAAAQRDGQALPETLRSHFQPHLGIDLGHVRLHADEQAASAARSVHARAYTLGGDIVFGAGQYAPDGSDGRRLLAHELAHVAQQAGNRPTIQRKEVTQDSDIAGPQDWTLQDRIHNTVRWQAACLTNLNAVDSSQYVKVAERRDFYKWFYEFTASKGFATRWALAASLVASGARQIADLDVDHAIANDAFDMANVELQGAMREGNQDIFDNVLPKLKKLVDGGPLRGKAAMDWDKQVLAEEQMLVQPIYSRMSPATRAQINAIARKSGLAGVGASISGGAKVTAGPHSNAGTIPEFSEPNLLNPNDRFNYGMKLGDQFTPGGTGFDPNRDKMPAVSAGYTNGSELAKIDTRAHLHELDAWLNPNRLSRVGPGSDIGTIVNGLTAFEKSVVLSDRSADGWAYSTQFAQFGFITEAIVRRALPSDPAQAAAVTAFVARFKAVQTRVMLQNPTPMMIGP